MRACFPAIVLIGLLSALPVGAQDIDGAEEYRACMELISNNRPLEALERAGQWAGLGGGMAAGHCRAAALLALDEPAAAADALETLAVEGRAEASIKADLLRQAAEAWRRAGQDERARGVLDAALRVTPGAPDLLEDRALLRVAAGEVWEAVDDLSAALDADPQRVSALVLRAAAWRRLEAADLAAADLDRALELDPSVAEAWLERGLLALEAGHRDTARRALIEVLAADPESPAADAARLHLERLETGQQPTTR